MRRDFVASLVALLLCASGSAHAAGIENCDSINSNRDRTECLQRNIVLVNAAFEVVTRELRAAADESRKSEGALQKQIDDLKTELKELKAAQPDLSGYIKYDGKVQLESLTHFGNCLDHDTHSAGHIQGWTCAGGGGQAWKLNRR